MAEITAALTTQPSDMSLKRIAPSINGDIFQTSLSDIWESLVT